MWVSLFCWYLHVYVDKFETLKIGRYVHVTFCFVGTISKRLLVRLLICLLVHSLVRLLVRLLARLLVRLFDTSWYHVYCWYAYWYTYWYADSLVLRLLVRLLICWVNPTAGDRSRSFLHTYISTVHSTDRERRADRPWRTWTFSSERRHGRVQWQRSQ